VKLVPPARKDLGKKSLVPLNQSIHDSSPTAEIRLPLSAYRTNVAI
jgi:hypothetical protein